MKNPGDAQASDLQKAESQRQVEEVTSKLERVEREKTEEIDKLYVTIRNLEFELTNKPTAVAAGGYTAPVQARPFEVMSPQSTRVMMQD